MTKRTQKRVFWHLLENMSQLHTVPMLRDATRVKFLRLLAHHEKTIECSFLQKLFKKKESPPGMYASFTVVYNRFQSVVYKSDWYNVHVTTLELAKKIVTSSNNMQKYKTSIVNLRIYRKYIALKSSNWVYRIYVRK